MKLLGIDFGIKKIGLAYSEGLLASPLEVIHVQSPRQALADIAAFIERLGVETIVIGISGGKIDKPTRAFGEKLASQTHVPVVYIDETLTSRQAIQKMVSAHTTQKKRRTHEDAVAATIILNIYLENVNSK